MDEPANRVAPTGSLGQLPTLVCRSWDWPRQLAEAMRTELATALSATISRRRWFGSKARRMAGLAIVDAVSVTADSYILLVNVRYDEGPDETYQVPLGFADARRALDLSVGAWPFLWARVASADDTLLGALYDPTCDVGFCQALLVLVALGKSVAGWHGNLAALPLSDQALLESADLVPEPVLSEQSNSSIVYSRKLILKLFRKVERGINPDYEVSARLTRQGYANSAPLVGTMEYRADGGEPWTTAVLQQFVPNEGDAWQYTLARLEEFLEHVRAGVLVLPDAVARTSERMCSASLRPLPAECGEVFAHSLRDATLLGQRTAEMHLALGADTADAAFAPQPYEPADAAAFRRRSVELVAETFGMLRAQRSKIPDALLGEAERLLGLEVNVAGRFDVLGDGLTVDKVRIHGDFHLGQVLVAAGDFIIIDFEGEPSRSLAERRQKQLALRDVAGMVRSFHYASRAAANYASTHGMQSPHTDHWLSAWYYWTSVAFLAGYRQTAAGASFVPQDAGQFERVFEACLLEKAVYELRYELNNRPDWVYLPLAALVDLLGSSASSR